MSLASLRFRFDLASFPRLRGDEPLELLAYAEESAFSPPTRG